MSRPCSMSLESMTAFATLFRGRERRTALRRQGVHQVVPGRGWVMIVMLWPGWCGGCVGAGAGAVRVAGVIWGGRVVMVAVANQLFLLISSSVFGS